MIEFFKSMNKFNPEFMWEIYKFKETPYSLRYGKPLTLSQPINRQFQGKPYLEQPTTTYIKGVDTLAKFKSDIKIHTPINCSCRL